MLPEKRKRTIVYFSLIFFVFIAILIYLMLFNYGLAIEESIDEISMQKKIFIKNESAKTIKNISVSYLEGDKKVKVADINKLSPNELYEINYNFPENAQKISLIVEAPFYQTVMKEIILGKPSTGLKYSIKSPAQIFEGVKFTISFMVCNPFSVSKEVTVGEKHSQEFFKEGSIVAPLKIDADSCKKIDYELTPKKKGDTIIYFNIVAQGITDEQTLGLRVE